MIHLEMHSVGHDSAILDCRLRSALLIPRRLIDYFNIMLYCVGTNHQVLMNRRQMFEECKEPVFEQICRNQAFDAYQFTNLEPSTVYKCKVEVIMLKEREIDNLIIHKSEDLVFNTASAPVDQVLPFDATYNIVSERNYEDQFDRETDLYNLNLKYRHPSLCESEKVLKDFAHPYHFPGEDQEEVKEKRKKVHSELLAARKSRNWIDFVNQSSKYIPHTEEGKQK